MAPVAATVVPPMGSAYVVFTKGNDGDEVVVRTLVGEFSEKGSNHGRKVYQKATDKRGADFVDVFLYYWDNRDGPSFEGWWFGNKLGGTQVWSHCNSSDMLPPTSGWKIPWDGGVRPTLVVMPKAEFVKAELEEKLRTSTAEVTNVEGVAKTALQQAKEVVGDYTNVEGLKKAEELLTPHATAMAEAQSRLMEAQKGATGDAARTFTQLATTLRTTLTAVSQELTKVRTTRAKVETEEKNRVAEEKDTNVYNEMMPEATQKANQAEDAVEKCVITSEMIQAGGEDMEAVRHAVDETEAAAKAAQTAIGEARLILNAKQAKLKTLESEKFKGKAGAELSKLQTQLQEAQNKLNPLKTVRQDFLQRAAAQKMVAEILEKLTPAEVDVDRAEETTALLKEDPSKDVLSAAELALAKANAQIDATGKMIEAKARSAVGLCKDELGKLQERIKGAQTRLLQLKGSQKEAAERVTLANLLKDAEDKLKAVQEAVAKAADAEGPFLMGVEELPLEETLTAVKSCETAATSANTSVSIARMFMATKMVEAKRFSAGPSEEAQNKLKEFQRQLEAHTKKLGDLKGNTAKRKHGALMREAEAQVANAEKLGVKVAEAAKVFEDDSALFELSSADIRKAAENTSKAEAAANAAVSEARKFLTARQIEAKSKEAPEEQGTLLIKFQTRLSSLQSETAKYKKMASTVEQRIAAKKSLEDAAAKVAAAEEKVKHASDLGDLLGETGDAAGDDGVKNCEAASTAATAEVKAVVRFLESQSRLQHNAKDELAKLQTRMQECQQKLDALSATMRDRAERAVVNGMVAEATQKATEAEAQVEKLTETEAPLLALDDMSAEEASKALGAMDEQFQAATNAVNNMKTFLAMKRLNAKRMSEKSAAHANAGMNKLQARLEVTTKKMADIKKGMADRKYAAVRKEVAGHLEGVRKLVVASSEATKALVGGAKDLEADAMKAACEKAGGAQQEAYKAVTAFKSLAATRQREAKSGDPSVLADLGKLVDQASALANELEVHKAQLREQEHRFVASRLIKDAIGLVESLEKKGEEAEKLATSLVSDKKEDFAADLYLGHVVTAIKANASAKSVKVEELFKEISGGSDKLEEEKFTAFLKDLPELAAQKEVVFGDEERKVAFKRINSKVGEGPLTLESFMEHFLSRYLCTTSVAMTDSQTVKGGKTIRKIAVSEVLEALEEPVKDSNLGMLRLKARAEKDGKEGWVSVSGNQGTMYLEEYTHAAVNKKRVQGVLQELAEAIGTTSKHLEQKANELKSAPPGPLSDSKIEISRLRPRVMKVQYSFQALNKRVTDAHRRHTEALELENRKRKEAADRQAASAITDEANTKVNELQEQVDKLMPAAEALVKSKGADQEHPLQALAQTQRDVEGLVASVTEAQAKFSETLDKLKTSARGPFTEARSALVKFKVKLGSFLNKCSKTVTALKAAHSEVASDANSAVSGALRAHCSQKSITPDALFKELCKSGQEIPFQTMKDFMSKIPDTTLKATQIDLGLDRYRSGVTRLGLLEMIQEFQVCVKEIAITTNFVVKESKTIRKLQPGEVIEVLEGGKVDEAIGLHRVKCKALSDKQVGFVTLRGNQGTAFLEKTSKPFFCCEQLTPLSKDFESKSSQAKELKIGEVVELLEGPRKESPTEIQRVRGRTAKDGKMGWVTMKDVQGNVSLELAKVMVCKTGVAITPSFDINEAKAIRKLDVGETLVAVGEEKTDEKRGLTRTQLRTLRDGKEGWVTVRGNQGTSYVEESEKHFKVTRSVPLEARFVSGSNTVRMLEEGEAFEVLEGPKPESKDGAKRIMGRSLADGEVGWLTLTNSVSPWVPSCLVSESVGLYETANGAKEERKLSVGEAVEALDTPVLDKASGAMRVRVRVEKDAKVGFVPVLADGGKLSLKPVVRGS